MKVNLYFSKFSKITLNTFYNINKYSMFILITYLNFQNIVAHYYTDNIILDPIDLTN